MADRLLQGFIRKFMLASRPFDPVPRPPFNDRQDGRFESVGKAGTGSGNGTVWSGEATDEPARADARPTESANCTSTQRDDCPIPAWCDRRAVVQSLHDRQRDSERGRA